ncbi:MAG: serine/threonine protein kinase [Erysipelotrichaceae bacterium]|nr:serine/threonine protein kinase [Erysipelotrichaceae bacterium]
MAKIGQVIGGKYEILKMVGKGGMSKVYLAMDKNLNKQWAVKEIIKNARSTQNEVVVQSAIMEANLIKQFDHPAIVRITDIIENDKVIYIIEDYIEGETLDTILKSKGAQPQNKVINWAIQICEALEYLHTRKTPVIYRDIKPANIMLKPEGNIKIIDFGIAREYKEENSQDTVCLGTRGYAAPEQYGNKGQSDARTDIYCLGMTLYHLLTGQDPSEPPYEIYPIRYWNPQLSAGLEEIIKKCIQLNPEDRYQNCAELIYALQHYKEYGLAYRQMQRKKLNLFIASASATIVFFFIGILGIVMKNKTNNADYDQNMLQAEKSSNMEEKANYYAQAIDIKPLASDAYYGMMDVFKDDAAFSIEEETILKNKLNANLSRLRDDDEYPNIAFEIGKLYWYYYDYGKSDQSDNQITRIKSAIQWFEDAAEYGGEEDEHYVMSKIYSDIGKFNRDITLNIEEASDQGKYAPYWSNINELVAMMDNTQNESEIIELEVYKLALYSIESYARKFKADGVTQAAMNELYQSVSTGLKQVATTSDKTSQMKQALLSRLETTRASIENAYREGNGS